MLATPLISIIITLIAVAILLYLISLIPGLDPAIMQLIRVPVIIVAVLYVASALFGGSLGLGHPLAGPCR